MQPEYRQQKRHLNERIFQELASLKSIRRLALQLGVSQDLISSRSIFLGKLAEKLNDQALKQRKAQTPDGLVSAFQFDEMETFEHTKCKPLSVGLAVESKTQIILGVSLASMPVGGPLAKLACRKYGPRADLRSQAASELFARIAPSVSPEALVETDQKRAYPSWLKAHFRSIQHVAYKGRRGCVAGQGELKKAGRDPLFWLVAAKIPCLSGCVITT